MAALARLSYVRQLNADLASAIVAMRQAVSSVSEPGTDRAVSRTCPPVRRQRSLSWGIRSCRPGQSETAVEELALAAYNLWFSVSQAPHAQQLAEQLHVSWPTTPKGTS